MIVFWGFWIVYLFFWLRNVLVWFVIFLCVEMLYCFGGEVDWGVNLFYVIRC